MIHSRVCRFVSLVSANTALPPGPQGHLQRSILFSSSLHPTAALQQEAHTLPALAVTTGDAEVTGRRGGPWLWAASLAAASVSGYVGYNVVNLSPQRRAHPSVGALVVPADWVEELTDGLVEVMNAESLELQAIFGSDHMFSAMVKNGLIADLRCFYDPQRRCLHALVRLGSGVSGYPRVQHGGFSAAFMDECMGLLFYALRSHRQLPFLGPAFTAHLEVDFRKRVEAAPGRLLLCTAELESAGGRKLWMRAALRDRPGGKVYAQGRALFVAPSTRRLLHGAARYMASGLLPGLFSMEE